MSRTLTLILGLAVTLTGVDAFLPATARRQSLFHSRSTAATVAQPLRMNADGKDPTWGNLNGRRDLSPPPRRVRAGVSCVCVSRCESANRRRSFFGRVVTTSCELSAVFGLIHLCHAARRYSRCSLSNVRIGIIKARWNDHIISGLREGAESKPRR
jgi:hypothetical protein